MAPNPKICIHETVNRQTGCCERCKQFIGFPLVNKADREIELARTMRLIREARAKAANADVQTEAPTTTTGKPRKQEPEPEKPKTEWRLAPGFHWDEYGNCVKE
jgi:hypothetical protein